MAQDPFLECLRKQPSDSDTHLIYADWLDEGGRIPEAEFLRLQHTLQTRRHGQRGVIGQCRQLYRLARQLPLEWLAVVTWPRIEGRVFWGTDTIDSPYTFRFLPGGVLNYTSTTGTFQNGTWTQAGNRITMEMNQHYADYEGFLLADRIVGKAHNLSGSKWAWDVTLTTDPEVCDPGNPITTVYLAAGNRRRRNSARPARPRRSREPGP